MFARELDAITRLLGKTPGSLLDVGCAYGVLLQEAHTRSIAAVGLELSDAAVQYCRGSGLSIRQGGLGSLEIDERFEVVFMWDVLEHLADPARAIAEAREHIVPGGVLTLVVPDRGSAAARWLGERWWSVCEPHLHY
ncbi:MAG: class I SAM-dependent methyltransferase, partial [Candidatus Eisenbacteria bacterium]|nr:class I SAM-dependent methyltransferase [Candidatus Eisenbacteria bacterium]